MGDAAARATLRTLLRAIDQRVTRVNGNSLWRDFVLQEARRHHDAPRDSARAEQLTRLAEDYTYLVRSVGAHKARAAAVTAPPHPRLRASSTPLIDAAAAPSYRTCWCLTASLLTRTQRRATA